MPRLGSSWPQLVSLRASTSFSAFSDDNTGVITGSQRLPQQLLNAFCFHGSLESLRMWHTFLFFFYWTGLQCGPLFKVLSIQDYYAWKYRSFLLNILSKCQVGVSIVLHQNQIFVKISFCHWCLQGGSLSSHHTSSSLHFYLLSKVRTSVKMVWFSIFTPLWFEHTCCPMFVSARKKENFLVSFWAFPICYFHLRQSSCPQLEVATLSEFTPNLCFELALHLTRSNIKTSRRPVNILSEPRWTRC